MRKLFLINFSLMDKIADKKNGITGEDATAFVTGVEFFFVLLVVEFFLLKIIPFRVSDIIIYGAMVIIWYFTHYYLRKVFRKEIIDLGIRKKYNTLSRNRKRGYLFLSIIIFFTNFLIFFALSVAAFGGYDKRW